MSVAQLGVPVLLVSPAVLARGGRLQGSDIRPPYAVVEMFSYGRLQNGDWVANGEGRAVRSEDVHLASNAEDLMALMQALGPEYWTDRSRNATGKPPP